MRSIKLFTFLLCVTLPHTVHSQEKFEVFTDNKDLLLFVQSVRAGNTIYISATVGLVKTSVATKAIYDGIEKVLKHFGLSYKEIIKETVICDDGSCWNEKNQHIRSDFYRGTEGPIVTWIVGKAFVPASNTINAWESWPVRLQIDLVVYNPK
jgi:enamine deaminase RidA (YjgF/YER057c/UK114 family)